MRPSTLSRKLDLVAAIGDFVFSVVAKWHSPVIRQFKKKADWHSEE
jgi:hypothetical protein